MIQTKLKGDPMQLLQAQSATWTSMATDPPKLRSLLLYPDSYKQCTLFNHPHNSYAVCYELGDEGSQQFARFTVYGNHTSQVADYQAAAKQLLLMGAPHVLKGSAIPRVAVGPIIETLQQHGWHKTYDQPCYQYTYSPSQEAGLTVPPGYRLDTLHEGDSAMVDQLWTFRSATSLPMITDLINTSHTSCVRLADGSPAAWMLEMEPLCGGMLHVLPQHRRKGLAKVVCLDLFRKLQQKWERHQQQHDVTPVVGEVAGPAVYCYVVEGNTASIQLMEALRLQQTGAFSWLGLRRSPS